MKTKKADITIPRTVSWKTWKERWALAQDVPTMEGLLHYAFAATLTPNSEWGQERAERCERVRLLLTVADGWNGFNGSNDPVKQKAIRVLADNFFKKETLNRHDPETVQAIIAFIKNPDNIGGSGYPDEIIWKFVESLCKETWRKGSFTTYQQVGEDGSYGAVPCFTRLDVLEMYYMGHCLEELVPGRTENPLTGEERWLAFDDTILARLEKMAMQHAAVPTIEEAVLMGSYPAQLLVLARYARVAIQKRIETRQLNEKIEQHKAALEKLGAKI